MDKEYTFTTTASDFELGIERPSAKKTNANVTYSKEAVLRYRLESIDEITEDSSKLLKMIQHHLRYQVPRLRVLEEYYLGNNPNIMEGERRTDSRKADHRVRHSWAAIISDFVNSYVLANPVKVEGAQEKFLDEVYEFNQANDIDSHNLEIGKDQNNLGRAYELIQRTEDDSDRIYRLEPTEVFMIYDTTVRTRVIGACRYYEVNQYDDTVKRYQVELYTPDRIISYDPIDVSTEQKLKNPVEAEHRFGGVPIVEYRSDRYRMGIFEKQIPLIDIYDSAQSDTANYMTDFNDAVLVIDGKYENVLDGSALEGLRDANILALIPPESDNGSLQTGKAYYLTKSYDVAGVEAYKDRIKEDIFTTASVPNLSDRMFGGNQSGEALKYKLFGLQQKRSDKEKYFAKGLRIRYKLLENLKREVREYTGESADLYFSFSANLPKAYLEELKEYTNAGGRISQETMISLLSFIEDPVEEMERMTAESETRTMGFSVDLMGDDNEHTEE